MIFYHLKFNEYGRIIYKQSGSLGFRQGLVNPDTVNFYVADIKEII